MTLNRRENGKTVTRIQYLITGTCALLLLGLIYGWSIFRAPLQEMFPTWTVGDLSLTFTILMLMFSVGSLTAGRLSLRISGRVLYLAMAVIMLVGFMGASLIDPARPQMSLVMLDVLYAVLCGFGTGMGHNITLSNIMRWYPDKQGLASGILLMGYGSGAMVLGAVADRLMAAFGVIITFRIIGVAAFVILSFVSFFIRRPSPDTVFPESKSRASQDSSREVVDCTPKQVLKSLPFWLYFLWCSCKTTACMIVVNSAAPIAAFYGAPAVMGLIVSVTNGIGRIFFGTAFDKFGFSITTRINNLVMLAAGALMVAGGMTRSIAVLVLGLLFTGMGFGSSPSFTTVYFHRLWGDKYFQSNYSLATFSLVVSSLIGPNISGFLQDRAPADDPYMSTFIFMAAVCVLSVVLGVIIRKKVKI